VVADPRAVAAGWHEPRIRILAEITILVTEAPWRLSRDHRERAGAAGLSDDDVLHAIALASLFGHLNRIADAVAVPLDYTVRRLPPRADPWVPALASAPPRCAGPPAIDLARRPATQAALVEWRGYALDRDAPLTRAQRAAIARDVAAWLGDGGASPDDAAPAHATELRALAKVVTLAPWQLGPASFDALRAAGFDDAALFDVCATASSAGVFSRIAVALGALAS
jgi:alkylhydroperoxidase family enzyme